MVLFWVAILAVSILLYVLLDGFDLGVGILFGLTSNEARRRAMMSAVAPMWDGNETSLVVAGVILWGAFPVVYATLFSAFRQFYPQGSGVRIVQVDIRAENIGRRTPVDLGVVGDVKATLSALLPQLKQKSDGSHLAQAREHYTKARKALDELAAPGKGLIHPQQIAKAVSDHAAEDAIFTCDVGLPTVWAARYLAMNGQRRLLGSFWHGSMANAMAQAIGAQAAFPGRQVISLSGDGGFQMLMGDFLSLAQLGLPVKVVVFNNGTLGFIELEQKSTGFLPFGTEFKNPNFAAMAEAAGVRGIRIEDPGEVETGITAALNQNGPVLIDAVVNRTELAMPPAVSLEMAKGFTLYMVKAVMSGRGDELIDLARTNLWR